MEELASLLLSNLPYLGVVSLLLLSGCGLPLPEDIPLLAAGYLCGIGQANIWVMVPLTLVTVVGADLILFWLGRRYGHHVPRLPLIRRYLREARLKRAEAVFRKHGGKTLFIARFLPGLRATVYFTAGGFKIPYWKILAFDGSAALISVPAIVLFTYYFADHIDQIRYWSREAQLLISLLAAAAIITFVAIRLIRKGRLASTG